MKKETMVANIKKVFGTNHSYTYQIESLAKVYPIEQVRFVYDQMIDGEKNYIQRQIAELLERFEELEEMDSSIDEEELKRRKDAYFGYCEEMRYEWGDNVKVQSYKEWEEEFEARGGWDNYF